jgi:hypothetical protein
MFGKVGESFKKVERERYESYRVRISYGDGNGA